LTRIVAVQSEQNASIHQTSSGGMPLAVSLSLYTLFYEPFTSTGLSTFDTNRTRSLINVSVAVILFAFFLGAVVQSKGTEVFVATATYAAVLVLFVGATGSSSG
jgi:hypothetical protein